MQVNRPSVFAFGGAGDGAQPEDAADDDGVNFGEEDGEIDFFGDTVDPIQEARDRLRKKNLALAEELAQAPKPPECNKCDGVKERFQKDVEGFFEKAAHYRKACEKLLEQCANFMSASQHAELTGRVQLDVYFLSRPEEPGESEELVFKKEKPAAPTSSADAALEKARQRMQAVEDLIREQTELNKQLKKDLAEGKQPTAPSGGRQLIAAAGQGPPTREMVIQTEKVYFKGENVPVVEVDDDGDEGVDPVTGKVRKKKTAAASKDTSPVKKAAPAGGAAGAAVSGEPQAEPEEDEGEPDVPGRPPRKRAGARTGGGGGGVGNNAAQNEENARLTAQQAERIKELESSIRRAESERDLLGMKVKAAERSRNQLQDKAKAMEREVADMEEDLATLRKKTEDAQRLVEALERQVADLKAAKAAAEAEAEAKKGKKKAGADGESKKEKKEKKEKKTALPEKTGADGAAADAAAAAGAPGPPDRPVRRLITDDGDGEQLPAEAAAAAPLAADGVGGESKSSDADGSSDGGEDDGSEKVDKCVGTDPECDPEPAPAPPKPRAAPIELNKKKFCYSRMAVGGPKFFVGSMSTGSLPPPIPEPSQAQRKSRPTLPPVGGPRPAGPPSPATPTGALLASACETKPERYLLMVSPGGSAPTTPQAPVRLAPPRSPAVP